MCPVEDGVAASAREDAPSSSSPPPLPLFVRRRLRLRREQGESDESLLSLPPLRQSGTGRRRLLDLAATERVFLPLVPDLDDDGCSDVGNGGSIEKGTANKVGGGLRNEDLICISNSPSLGAFYGRAGRNAVDPRLLEKLSSAMLRG